MGLALTLPWCTKASNDSSWGRWMSLPDDLDGEDPSHLDLLQLTFLVLVKAADPKIFDALPVLLMILIEFCQVELYVP